MGITEVPTAPHSPWQHAFAERLIGSSRRECLNHVLVLGERHLRRILARYFAYYTGPALISRSTRMRRTPGPSSSPTRAGSWRFPKSVACIIATSAGRRSSTPASLTTTELASQVRLCLPLPVLLANPV